MQRRQLFGLLLSGAVTAGALATTFGTGIVFADQGQDHGQGKGRNQNTGQQGPGPQRRGVSGELTSVAGTAPTLTLMLATTQDGAVKVLTSAQTVFRGKDHDDRSLADLSNLKGRRLNVRGERNATGDLVASHVVLRPAASDDEKTDKGKRVRATGTISAVSDTKLTVKRADGSEQVFAITKDTGIRIDAEFGVGLKTGQSVRVSGSTTGGDPVATRVRVPAAS
jgi:hypothetical protein